MVSEKRHRRSGIFARASSAKGTEDVYRQKGIVRVAGQCTWPPKMRGRASAIIQTPGCRATDGRVRLKLTSCPRQGARGGGRGGGGGGSICSGGGAPQKRSTPCPRDCSTATRATNAPQLNPALYSHWTVDLLVATDTSRVVHKSARRRTIIWQPGGRPSQSARRQSPWPSSTISSTPTSTRARSARK